MNTTQFEYGEIILNGEMKVSDYNNFCDEVKELFISYECDETEGADITLTLKLRS
jgi:hypothetical protein